MGGGPRGSESGNRRSRKNVFLTESGNWREGPNQGIRELGPGIRARPTAQLGTSGHDGRVAAVIRAEGAENLAVSLHNMAGIT
jgi:hypothetical protein